ncbi:hypothetical protein B0J12DRAFT_670588 [Macrophomina phaseolina]|uniref:Ubiquitin-like domain-containing protein n=1 Tax=Macrophomina phaseolina TaxID=35725 RepID=A0ABQ8G7B7_9PEZI|nr:hypothetical protein B0J12DRAFT_670588 [Macrophomina phaseolina]
MATQTVDVRVLSPSPEADGGITFSALSTSTTIGELKLKIKDELPSHPAPERMRIIYLGRVVMNETTLGAVLGEIQQGRVYNIHMVLSEAPTARSSTAPPSNPFRHMPQPNNAPNARAAAFNRPQSQPPRPDRVPGPDNPPFAAPNVHQGVPITSAAFVEQINLAHQAAMRQMQQMQQDINQRRTSEGPQPSDNNSGQASGGHSRSASQPTNTNHPQPQAQPGRVTITQGGIGPNGERWSFSVNNGAVLLPQQQLPLGLPQLPIIFDPRPPIRLPDSLSGMDSRRMLDQVHSNLEAAQQQVAVINNILAPPNFSREEAWLMPPAQFQRAAIEIERLNIYLNTMDQLLHTLVANPLYSRNRELVSLQMDNESMRSATRRLIRTLGDHISARRQETQAQAPRDPQPTNPSAPAAESRTDSAPRSSNTNNVFLLSSSNGPHAIVYSPEGTFTAPGSSLFGDALTQNLAYQRALSDVARLMGPTHASLTDRPVPPQNAAVPGAAADLFPAPGEVVREDQPQNPLRNPLLAGIQPPLQQQILQQQQEAMQLPIAAIATHFWLLLRIFGMLWFFSGAGWQRTLMLSLCGMAIYIIQAGLLGERFFGNRWDSVRRYFENLVGIPPQRPDAQQQRPAQQQGQANEANGNGAADLGPPGRRGRRRDPSPEEVAQRLLRERGQHRQTWLRERVRGVERSTALFVASLWPGLGERMVAAREEAEAQARRDAQDREEAERREAAEAEAREQEAQTQAQAGQGDGEAGVSGVNGDAEKEKAARDGSPAPVEADRVDKGKGRAVDAGEASSSSLDPAANEGQDGVAASRQRDGWSFADVD